MSQYQKLCGETGVELRDDWWHLGEATLGAPNAGIADMDVGGDMDMRPGADMTPADPAAEDEILSGLREILYPVHHGPAR